MKGYIIYMRQVFKLIVFLSVFVLAMPVLNIKGFMQVKKVAIIDTGFDFKSKWRDAHRHGLVRPKLCKTGHKDFTGTGIQDTSGHGTQVASIIAKEARNARYCLVILKVWDEKTRDVASYLYEKAIRYANALNVDVINISGGGKVFSIQEYLAVKRALDRGIIIVAAAGNEGQEVNHIVHSVKINAKQYVEVTYINRKILSLTNKPVKAYFPACYDSRIISVVNIDSYMAEGDRITNYGRAFNSYASGDNITSLLPNEKYGRMSGTSMSAPKKVGEILRNWKKRGI